MKGKHQHRGALYVWISLSLSVGIFLGEQLLSSQYWWPDLPWSEMSVALLLLVIGSAIRDFLSPEKVILNSLPFVDDGKSVSATFLDSVQDETDWLIPAILRKIKKDTGQGHLVVRVHDDRGETFVLKEVRNAPNRKGDQIRLRLCWIRLLHSSSALKHSIWGETPGSLELEFKDGSVVFGKPYWIEVDYSWGDWYKSVSWHLLKVSPSPSAQSVGPWITFLNLDDTGQRPPDSVEYDSLRVSLTQPSLHADILIFHTRTIG